MAFNGARIMALYIPIGNARHTFSFLPNAIQRCTVFQCITQDLGSFDSKDGRVLQKLLETVDAVFL